MAKLFGYLIVFVGFIALVLGVSLVFAYPTKWLINWLIQPEVLVYVFGVPKIAIWQAWGINALCGFLFKGSSSTTTKK